jgi:flagellar biosynthesis protein FlhF
MKVKTFHALTMQDAMKAIKEELGPDAIILSSKEVREGGRLLRVFNRPVLEVMAASDQDVQRSPQVGGEGQQSDPPVRLSEAEAVSSVSRQTFQQTLQAMLQPTREQLTLTVSERSLSVRPVMAEFKQDHLRHLHCVADELNRVVHAFAQEERQTLGSHLSPGLVPLCRSFVEQGMHPSTVELLLHGASEMLKPADAIDDEAMRHALKEHIVRRIRTGEPLLNGCGHPAIGLLIGPSGAGKTSVVAKLASYYRLEQGKSVSLITFATDQEHTVEEMHRYAKMVGVPFTCALSARQVHEGLCRHGRVDVVLIDIPGIGQDELALTKELYRLLPQETIATHLVLPASIREQEARRIVGHLGNLSQLRLLFTKLDESESYGNIFEVAYQTGVPLSYWSIGRRVPEDIEVASAERLAACLTAEDSVNSRALVHQSLRSSEAAPVLTGVGTHHG